MSATEESNNVPGTMVNARRKKTSDLPHLPEFGKVGHLSATEGEILLTRTKSGLLRTKVTDQIVARLPRDELEEVELEERRGFARLRMKWKGARLWEFDVAGANRRTAREFVEALDGRVVQRSEAAEAEEAAGADEPTGSDEPAATEES